MQGIRGIDMISTLAGTVGTRLPGTQGADIEPGLQITESVSSANSRC